MLDKVSEFVIPAVSAGVTALLTFVATRKKDKGDIQKFYVDKVEELIERQEAEIKSLTGKVDSLTEENNTLKKLLMDLKEDNVDLKNINKELISEITKLKRILIENGLKPSTNTVNKG